MTLTTQRLPCYPRRLRAALVQDDPRACITLGLLYAPTDALLALTFLEAAIAKARGGGDGAAAGAGSGRADAASECRREAWWLVAQLHAAAGAAADQAAVAAALTKSLAAGVSVRAARQLGLCCLRGYGVPRDVSRARQLLGAALDRCCSERDGALAAGGRDHPAVAASLGIEHVLRLELAEAERVAAAPPPS